MAPKKAMKAGKAINAMAKTGSAEWDHLSATINMAPTTNNISGTASESESESQKRHGGHDQDQNLPPSKVNAVGTVTKDTIDSKDEIHKLNLLLQELVRTLGPSDVSTMEARRRLQQALMKEGGQAPNCRSWWRTPCGRAPPRHDDSDLMI